MAGWPNLSDLVSVEHRDARVALLGAPLAAGSVTPGACDQAPGLLRRTLRRIGRYDIDTRRELATPVLDRGDVDLAELSIDQATPPLADAVWLSVAAHELTLVIGGNNAVTRPAVHGLAKALNLPLDRIGLITLDAHFDMRDLDQGLSNGNPVRALIEDGLPGRNIAQIGLAPWANTRSMHELALASGNLVTTAAEVRRLGVHGAVNQALGRLEHLDAIAVDCDIDVIDRSQFPAAPGARADGLAAHEFFEAARLLAAHPKVRVTDLTEWDPPLDPTDLSALTAARWVAECLAGFEMRQAPSRA
ncbi:MAG TPA: arginase family protein [Sphingomicrobium sp.]|nr:arginase family protein [Sphingomicrobium sp.]